MRGFLSIATASLRRLFQRASATDTDSELDDVFAHHLPHGRAVVEEVHRMEGPIRTRSRVRVERVLWQDRFTAVLASPAMGEVELVRRTVAFDRIEGTEVERVDQIGMSADEARAIARRLISAADALDEGHVWP